MSDNVELVNMEDDAPVAAQEAPAPAAPEAPAALVAEAQPAEVEAVEVGGQKYVPLAAVIAERKEKQALKQSAERAAQLESEIAQARPYVDFLKANPHLLQQQPRQPEPAPAPQADPDAVEAARLMDFYKADGTLDADKGARWLALQDKRAGAVAKQAVQPYAQITQAQAADRNYAQMANPPGASGQKADPTVLNQLWGALPMHLRADPGVAGLIHAAAIGFSKGQPAPIAPPPAPPIVTEASGGNPNARPALSALERAVAAVKGVDEKKWIKQTEGFTKGRTSALED